MALPQPLPRVPNTEEIVPMMNRIINAQNATRECILETVTPITATFDNVMLPLAQVENAVQGELGMIYMLQYGSPSLETQAAFDEARKLFLEAEASWTADVPFFRLLQAASTKPDFESLDMESQHLLEKKILGYKNAGHGFLDNEELEKYRKLETEIADLEMKFQQNISREAGGVWFTIEELDGVPEDELAKWKDDGSEGENLINGHLRRKFVPFANGGTLAVLTHAHSPKTRKGMFVADNLKLKENKPLFEEIIIRRAKKAKLLKYNTHAEFRIQSRMVKTTEWVKVFLDELREALCGQGQDELAALQRRRQEDLQVNQQNPDAGAGFPPWDKRYYERALQHKFEVDQIKVSEFFPLQETATRMLDIFATVLGLRFDSIATEDLNEDVIWHDTVECFSVWDAKDNGFIGYLYFDLLWRENKYRGNQSVNIQCGYLRPDGTRQYPSTILMCSFPTATPTSCALLKHHQVVTLFHEMGHGIHDLLARTKYTHFHGYRLPPDFGEMPSIMLENWCWREDVLQGLSCHYTALDENYLAEWQKKHPGQPDPPTKIPVDLLKPLIKHRYFSRGLYHQYQLSTSIFDVQIHSLSTEDDIADLNIQKMWYDLREEIEGMDFSECRDGYAFGTFTHLTAGYDMCYYSYLCCTAMAQDVFLSVFSDGPFNTDAWDKYRRGILECGGSPKDLLRTLEAFLGRPPNMNALVESLARAREKRSS
ncbi:peptidase family M3 [Penicillium longicatenatum]|uniref:peptidase family M3 n=1 Tax=Penicillium longicatenatum TaxID=1561947 RepID=UPI002549798C|nr:peptidase family M3 [Penicillium longicatenatum]KAJ5643693.1 peptidase family M3 [Penicillium longicatenatum]